MSENHAFKIFVVEDNEWYNKLLVHNLSLNPDYEIHSFLNGKACLEQLHQQPDLITLDYRLPDISGLELLKKIKSENEEIQVILISEQGDIEVVVDLLKEGAYDYIVKSNDIRERLLNTVQNIRKGIGLRKEVTALRREVQKKYSFNNTLLGESEPIKKVYDLINKALHTNITVSLSGETGTGKELAAKAIHYNSKRKNKSFVPVNLSAIPSELIESELFGHEKGSFTGATYRRIGKFEEAHGGTLFLDEIGEMALTFQAKLLRALQEKEISRVGSNQPVKTDCRIIVATNKNLLEEVRKGTFREDLYYRLLGLSIEMPPLRERGKDILILGKHFADNFAAENQLSPIKFTTSAQNKLLGYTYPGNVRELKSVVELAVTLTDNNEIDADNLVFGSGDPLPGLLTGEMTLREYERRIVNSYLDRYNNNIKLVAEKLDIGISTIYRMLKEE
ncbi:MAG: sigma-54-dependent transcriptional regulator [Bacteroidota bacterium]